MRVLQNHSGRVASSRKKFDDIFSRLQTQYRRGTSSHPAIFRQQGQRYAYMRHAVKMIKPKKNEIEKHM